jgi:hypothetical protein
VGYCRGEQSITFTDVTLTAGINIARRSYGNPIWGDFNGDGQLDVFVVNHGQFPTLLQNNGDESFTDVWTTSGIACCGDRHGAAWGDYDNDGDLDLHITVGGGRGETLGEKKDQLYRNDGNGRFTDVTEIAGVANILGRGRSVNWVDVNRDGYLDLFLKNFETPNGLYLNNDNSTFTAVHLPDALANAVGSISSWVDYDRDGDVDLLITGWRGRDQLWRNNGDGTFTEVASQVGLVARGGSGQGVAWGDYNNDGHLDLFVARGFGDTRGSLDWGPGLIIYADEQSDEEGGLDFVTTGDQVTFNLYRDRERFQDRCQHPEEVFLGSAESSPTVMPFTVTAADAAGQPIYIPGRAIAYFVWQDTNGWHLRWTSNREVVYFTGRITSNGQFTAVQPVNFTPGNLKILSTLYRNNGNGTFTDVTHAAGVANSNNNRGVVWGDYDNDGYLDLYVVNGGSFQGNEPNVLYHNNGDGTFTEIPDAAGARGDTEGRGDGAAWGDFNNDGFLDLYVVNGRGRPTLPRTGDLSCLVTGPHLLYRNNRNTHRWLKVGLVGTVSNRDALGAQVTLQAGGLRQFREVNGGGGGQFFSQGSGPVHFGLGQAEGIDSLTVSWPSGLLQELTNIGPNQTLTLVEGQSIAFGQPTFQAGGALGYYIWQDRRGRWQIRWNGGGGKQHFAGTITTNGDFVEVTPVGFEGQDQFTWNTGIVSFDAFASISRDGLQFRTTGKTVTFDLQLNGMAVPALVHIGQQAVSPAVLPVTLE